MTHSFVCWKGLQSRWILLGLSWVLRAETTLDTHREVARDKARTSGRGEVDVGWRAQLEHKIFDAKNGVYFFLSYDTTSSTPTPQPSA